MSQKPQSPKTKLVPEAHNTVIINQPMVRTFSTGGGHGPENTLTQGEGDHRMVTKKFQGFPPENLNVLGKSTPPVPEVAIPRFTGKAEYATRVHLPNMLYAKVLTSEHSRAKARKIDVSKAEKMPGVAFVLTPANSPKEDPLSADIEFSGQALAIVAAETEDLAEDAVAAIDVDYETLPFAATLEQSMAPNAPDLRMGRGNLLKVARDYPEYSPEGTAQCQHGDLEQGFREAEVVKEFSYYFAGAVPVPLQPSGCVAKWDGDRLTFWGMGQTVYQSRNGLARDLGIDAEKIRFINKWNGCTLGGANGPSAEFYTWIAHIAKMTGRPVKLMLPKSQELAYMKVKPETVTTFRVGAKKNGQIVAVDYVVKMTTGRNNGTGFATAESARNQLVLYTTHVPHWRARYYLYKTNAPQVAASRSNTQQEIKWAWEGMIDEMAEAFNVDPVEYRLMHVPKPGSKLSPAKDWNWDEYSVRLEQENGALTFDSYASVEVLREGAKLIGWENRNKKAGDAPGRFKRGIGLGMSQHHCGHMGYHEGEPQFQKLVEEKRGSMFGAAVEVGSDGRPTMRYALPDSGTNHGTSMSMLVAEMLGFTSRDFVKVEWGDSAIAPPSGGWNGGKTTMLQGGAICAATEKLRKDLLDRAAKALQVDASQLKIRDGVISSTADPKKSTTFAALAKANGGIIKQEGRCIEEGHGRSLTKGIGCCFLDVEVDTWTGNFRFVRAVYAHDAGFIINPLVGESDQHGSFVQSAQMTLDALPWDREFPGTAHYSCGYLSYRMPTMMEVPEMTNLFINSLEPRWYYGAKSFAETSIGSVPGVVANAIYNACGVRIREHPVTREKIMAGLKAQRAQGRTA
jgi:CO/xanthine dehydrogenase Mo-binding subunit